MASADNQSTTMPVLANLLPSFSVSTTSLDFGTWVIGNYILYSSATISVQATPGTTYAITMDAGQNFDGVNRNVANGPYNVPFIIFDPTNSFLWGDAGFAGTYASGSACSAPGPDPPRPSPPTASSARSSRTRSLPSACTPTT
jgi:spore coat protein U-like protein